MELTMKNGLGFLICLSPTSSQTGHHGHLLQTPGSVIWYWAKGGETVVVKVYDRLGLLQSQCL